MIEIKISAHKINLILYASIHSLCLSSKLEMLLFFPNSPLPSLRQPVIKLYRISLQTVLSKYFFVDACRCLPVPNLFPADVFLKMMTTTKREYKFTLYAFCVVTLSGPMSGDMLVKCRIINTRNPPGILSLETTSS